MVARWRRAEASRRSYPARLVLVQRGAIEDRAQWVECRIQTHQALKAEEEEGC